MAADVIVIATGIAPVEKIPAINAVGNPEVVEPVPIYPKFGMVNCASVKALVAVSTEPAATPVMADPAAASPVITEPAATPVIPEPANMPVIPDPAAVPILPTNGASRNVKLLVADATDVTADVALLTNHDTLFVAFCVMALITEPAAVPVTTDPAATPVTPDPAAVPVTNDPATVPVTPEPAATEKLVAATVLAAASP